jgi:hypothetical protein
MHSRSINNTLHLRRSISPSHIVSYSSSLLLSSSFSIFSLSSSPILNPYSAIRSQTSLISSFHSNSHVQHRQLSTLNRLPPIIFEDERIVVFNKPHSLSVHGKYTGFIYLNIYLSLYIYLRFFSLYFIIHTITHFLLPLFHSPDGTDHKDHNLISLLHKSNSQYSNLFLVHRLDKDTSGCLVLAKTAQWAKHFTKLFAKSAKKLQKTSTNHKKNPNDLDKLDVSSNQSAYAFLPTSDINSSSSANSANVPSIPNIDPLSSSSPPSSPYNISHTVLDPLTPLPISNSWLETDSSLDEPYWYLFNEQNKSLNWNISNNISVLGHMHHVAPTTTITNNIMNINSNNNSLHNSNININSNILQYFNSINSINIISTEILKKKFRTPFVCKKYLAFVYGKPQTSNGR